MLAGVPKIDLTLFKGGGKCRSEREHVLWNLPQNSTAAARVSRAAGRGRAVVEEATFALSLLPYLIRAEPDLVYLSNAHLCRYLWRWRRFSGRHFALLFRNGEPLHPPPVWCDHVQQIAPIHGQTAIAAGFPRERQTLLATGFFIDPKLTPLSAPEKQALRAPGSAIRPSLAAVRRGDSQAA